MAAVYHSMRVSDADILDFFRNIQLTDYADTPTCFMMDRLIFPLSDGKSPAEQLTSADTYLIHTVSYNVESLGLRIDYKRGHRARITSPNVAWEPGDPFVDGLAITGPAERNGPVALNIASAINKFLSLAPPVMVDEKSETAIRHSSVILDRISAAAAQIAEHTAERQKQLDVYRQELKSEADAHLEEVEERLRDKHADRVMQLHTREKEISARETLIDDRENTHVRREIQTRLTTISDDLLSQPLLQKSSSAFSALIIICGCAGMIFSCAAFFSGAMLAGVTDKTAIYFIEATRILLGLGAAATFWFAIRQASLRYTQVVKWENELHRFKLDTERASFLIEGDLEARKASSSGLPEVMLERFSRGLFNHEGGKEEPDMVGHTLAHLLNRPASLELGSDGFKVSVDKAALRKAAKDLDKEAAD